MSFAGFPSLLSPFQCQVVKWKGDSLFLYSLCTHTVYIYIYITVYETKKLSFQWNPCFFNNQLFLNVIRTIILYSYYRVWGRVGEDALGGLFLPFLQGFIFDFFFFFLVGHFCFAGICAEPYSGKNNDM